MIDERLTFFNDMAPQISDFLLGKKELKDIVKYLEDMMYKEVVQELSREQKIEGEYINDFDC